MLVPLWFPYLPSRPAEHVPTRSDVDVLQPSLTLWRVFRAFFCREDFCRGGECFNWPFTEGERDRKTGLPSGWREKRAAVSISLKCLSNAWI